MPLSRILAAAAFAGLVFTLPAIADPLLTVTGHGSVVSAETEARLTATAEARGSTAAEAMAAQRTAAANITKALAKAGVAQKDFAITNLNMNPQYGPGANLPGQQRVIAAYVCNTTVSVVLPPERLDEVMKALGEAGISQNVHVNFMAHGTDAQQAEAHAAAVKDAFARAQVLAKQTGVTLGRVAAVTDGVPGNGMVNYAEQVLAVMGNGGVNHTLNAAVTVSWEIK